MNTLQNIEEDVIDRDLCQADDLLDEIIADMQYLRHNNPQLFKKYAVNCKGFVEKANILASRVRLMNEYLRMEEI